MGRRKNLAGFVARRKNGSSFTEQMALGESAKLRILWAGESFPGSVWAGVVAREMAYSI